MKIYLRGIYSTALTKLLLDKGFKISYPSRTIRERLNLEELRSKPDAVVIGSSDGHGVIVRGSSTYVDRIVEAVVDSLEAVVVRRSPIEVGAVYRGRVVELSDRGAVLDLGTFRGLLKDARGLKPGEELMVQTVKPLRGGVGALLRRRIAVEGFYMALTWDGFVRFEEPLRRAECFHELMGLASLVIGDGMGVRWKTIASKAPLEELLSELKELKSKMKSLKKNSALTGLLLPGEGFCMLEFPCKDILDELRGLVTATIKGHHIFRSIQGLGVAVDLAEKLLAEGVDRRLVEDCLERLVGFKCMKPGYFIEFEHRKLDGRVLRLTPGVLIGLEQNVLTVKRRIRGLGTYDGLKIAKEAGDYAITKVKPGGWLVENRYFSSRGELKGVYININTPAEVVRGLVRYLDLGVDVVAKPREEPKVLDLEELEGAYMAGIITKAIYERALNAVKEAENLVRESWRQL